MDAGPKAAQTFRLVFGGLKKDSFTTVVRGVGIGVEMAWDERLHPTL